MGFIFILIPKPATGSFGNFSTKSLPILFLKSELSCLSSLFKKLFDQEKVTSDIYEYAWNTLDDILNDLDIIFYCCPLEMEDDGERSTNESFRSDIANSMTQLLYQEDWNPLKIHEKLD